QNLPLERRQVMEPGRPPIPRPLWKPHPTQTPKTPEQNLPLTTVPPSPLRRPEVQTQGGIDWEAVGAVVGTVALVVGGAYLLNALLGGSSGDIAYNDEPLEQ